MSRVLTYIRLNCFAGLGFNIIGGKNAQYLPGDSGIFVTRVKPSGAAALDGRLREGDRIISVIIDSACLSHYY